MAFTYLLFGAIGLAAVLLVARLLAKADLATLAAVLKWVGGTLAALLMLFLVVRGFGAAALMIAAVAFMMLKRRLGRRPTVGGLFGVPNENAADAQAADNAHGENDDNDGNQSGENSGTESG